MNKFKDLQDFIRNKMRMSHIYQPVMLIELLQNNGSATINQIARSLLDRDISQVEYYEHITKSMVGRVLTKNRGITEKQGDSYSLNGFGELSPDEVDQLVEDCISRIDEYVTRRGEGIWSHRRKSSGYISGTDRYEVLKRAKFRCELCGVFAHETGSCAGCNLRGVNLSGLNLEGADLRRADLSNANLSSTRLVRADLWQANLNGATLDSVDLTGVNLGGLDLRGRHFAQS